MIIDSHAHYAHPMYNIGRPLLCAQDGNYAVVECANREELLEMLRENNIVGIIEPSIEFDRIDPQLALVAEHQELMWATVGVHPTRCVNTDWENHKKLKDYAKSNKIIAIGETGFDYHYSRKEQFRLKQLRWFVYQIQLAHKLKLPLILHTRDADSDVLKILNLFKRKLHGGVAHCFKCDHIVAEKYIKLGFAIGVGGTILKDTKDGIALRDAVKHVPLTSILVETDAPFVMPHVDKSLCKSGQRKKLCNSSLILPLVIQKIAEIREESIETVENTIYQNTIRVFNLK